MKTETAQDQNTNQALAQAYVIRPKADVLQTETGYEIWVDMPGVAKDDLKVEVEKNHLNLFGKVRDDLKAKSHYSEYPVADYQRAFRLGEGIDKEQIKADFNQGVLKLTLTKAKEADPKTIEIN